MRAAANRGTMPVMMMMVVVVVLAFREVDAVLVVVRRVPALHDASGRDARHAIVIQHVGDDLARVRLA